MSVYCDHNNISIIGIDGNHSPWMTLILGWWRGVVRGTAFDPINEVTVCRARLVLRWVTACGQVNHLGM